MPDIIQTHDSEKIRIGILPALMASLAIFAALGATACNTVEGAGEDIEDVGEGIEDAADDD